MMRVLLHRGAKYVVLTQTKQDFRSALTLLLWRRALRNGIMISTVWSRKWLRISFCLVLGFGLFLNQACEKKPAAPTAPEEPAVQVDPEIVAWLKSNCIPFSTSKPGSGSEDLMPLKGIVGSARVVALGEATHGTKEFFEMKHRILQFLVEEMGFNIFAIEAAWAESNLVNDYVQTGRGDPARLLAGLGFWTWNTQEVLDMILWMRQHNENPGRASKVSFCGFDMQTARTAMDSVIAYLSRVDASAATWADSLYAPFHPYSSSGSSYTDASADVKSLCSWNVQAVYGHLLEHRQEYESKTSTTQFALALQAARVAVQMEAYFGVLHSPDRDGFMAENAQWWLNQGGPNAKIVLWAHNGHVSEYQYTMGRVLRSVYGREMVVLGFDFGFGSFNAVQYNLATSQATGSPTRFEVEPPPSDSYEYTFEAASLPRFFLDMRDYPAWLLGPLRFRSIGAVYDQSSPLSYFAPVPLPSMFDVVIYFQNTSPSTLLPFY
jgi:erythromycin esterase